MRMWNCNPRIMCRQHLLGEHLEMHMFVGAVKKGHSIQGYLTNGLLDPFALKRRHDDLVREMLRRGYDHNTPIWQPRFPPEYSRYVVTGSVMMLELIKRCPECRALHDEHYKGIRPASYFDSL